MTFEIEVFETTKSREEAKGEHPHSAPEAELSQVIRQMAEALEVLEFEDLAVEALEE